jgi:putative flippase GtrA
MHDQQGRSTESPTTRVFPAFLDVRFVKFVAVGAINTLFGLVVYLVVLRLTDNLVMAVVVANFLGPAFNFVSMSRLVFSNKRLLIFLPFLAGYGALSAINIPAIVALQRFGVSAASAQILCIPALVILSYLINDRMVFRGRQ